MKLKNHIDWIKNKSDICLTKERRRERRGRKRLIATRTQMEFPSQALFFIIFKKQNLENHSTN